MHALITVAVAAAVVAVVGFAGLFWYAQFLGWGRLAKRYALKSAAAGRYRVDSLLLGEQSWYGPPARVDVGPQGIDLTPVFPYSLVFRPVRIPGPEIAAAERKQNAFFKFLRLQVGRGPSIMVGFPPSDALYAIQKRLRMPIRPVA